MLIRRVLFLRLHSSFLYFAYRCASVKAQFFCFNFHLYRYQVPRFAHADSAPFTKQLRGCCIGLDGTIPYWYHCRIQKYALYVSNLTNMDNVVLYPNNRLMNIKRRTKLKAYLLNNNYKFCEVKNQVVDAVTPLLSIQI